MKIDRFKQMMNVIETREDNDPIWWSGYLFLDLTEKQCKKVYIACAVRFGEKWDRKTGEYTVVLPSGIGIRRFWDNAPSRVINAM